MLYKYVTFARGMEILRNRKIRLTQPGEFNDPFELHPSFDLMSRTDIAALPDAPPNEDGTPSNMKVFTQEALQLMLSAALQVIQKNAELYAANPGVAFAINNNDVARTYYDQHFGILSLSQTHDNLLMWAHYADYHHGFVIGFDDEHPFFKGAELVPGLPRLCAVEYNEKRPVLSPSTQNTPQIFFRKSPDWSYEREWRLIRPLIESDEQIYKNLYPVHLFCVPADAIAQIVTGAQMRQQEYQELCGYCTSVDNMKHVKIHHILLSKDTYSLETHPPIDGKVNPQALAGKTLHARDLDV